MSERSTQPELIDLGPSYYTFEEYENCLHQLQRIGKYLGGDKASIWAFDQLQTKPTSILDVGCGGGFFAHALSKKYPEAIIHGIDLSKEAIGFARKNFSNNNLNYLISKTAELSEPEKSYDVVTATLVCHHLSDEAIVDFLKRSFSVAKKAVIINDLHRHVIAKAFFAPLAYLFFNNRLICHDGLLSIKKGFTRKELLAYLKKANIPENAFSLTWHFPFRWTLILYPET